MKKALMLEKFSDLKYEDVVDSGKVKKVRFPMLPTWIMMQWGWISLAPIFGREYTTRKTEHSHI